MSLHYGQTWANDVGSRWPPVKRVSLTVSPHNGPTDGSMSMSMALFDVSKKPLQRPTIANLIASVNQYEPTPSKHCRWLELAQVGPYCRGRIRILCYMLFT